MKKYIVACLTVLALVVLAAPAAEAAKAPKSVNRCGWIANVTPGNFWIVDKAGEWTIAVQGGYQAKNFDKQTFDFGKNFEKTNGNYGFGCGCVRGTTEIVAGEQRFASISSIKPKALKACYDDKALAGRGPAPIQMYGNFLAPIAVRMAWVKDEEECKEEEGEWEEDAGCVGKSADSVDVTRGEDGAFEVNISTMSFSGNMCEFGATAKQVDRKTLVARADVGGDKPCVVTLSYADDDTLSTSADDVSNCSCGMNAGLDIADAKREERHIMAR